MLSIDEMEIMISGPNSKEAHLFQRLDVENELSKLDS
jgi:hypothetical protein